MAKQMKKHFSDEEVLDLPPLEDLDFLEAFSMESLKMRAIDGGVAAASLVVAKLLTDKIGTQLPSSQYTSPILAIVGGTLAAEFLGTKYPKYADIAGAVIAGWGLYKLVDSFGVFSKLGLSELSLGEVATVKFPEFEQYTERGDPDFAEPPSYAEEFETPGSGVGMLSDGDDEAEEEFADIDTVNPLFV